MTPLRVAASEVTSGARSLCEVEIVESDTNGGLMYISSESQVMKRLARVIFSSVGIPKFRELVPGASLGALA